MFGHQDNVRISTNTYWLKKDKEHDVWVAYDCTGAEMEGVKCLACHPASHGMQHAMFLKCCLLQCAVIS